MKRFGVLALFLVALVPAVMPVGAQPVTRDVPTMQLQWPLNGATVSDADVTFTWDYIAAATDYKLTITNIDGSQSITVNYVNAACDFACTNGLYPADYGWIWKENATYKWQIKAKDGSTTIAKSPKFKFTTDMLVPVVLITPEDDASVQTTASGDAAGHVVFRWEPGEYDYTKFTIYRANGEVFYSRNVIVADVCSSGPCNFLVYFLEMDPGEVRTFTWKVIGRRNSVAGKGKSPKYTVTVQRVQE